MSYTKNRALQGNDLGGGRQIGLTNNGDTAILACSPSFVQNLETSLDICHQWLAHLFASADEDDAWRLAFVWPEYLRQRTLWAEVSR